MKKTELFKMCIDNDTNYLQGGYEINKKIINNDVYMTLIGYLNQLNKAEIIEKLTYKLTNKQIEELVLYNLDNEDMKMSLLENEILKETE